MEKNNKLIAEFMGLIKYSEQHDGMYCVETMELDDFPILFKDGSYDSSWDWLMPVVQKIGDEYLNTPFDETYSHLTEQYENIWTLEDTYNAVVEFIKDYNQNN
jgi:hypothetical protein